MSRLVLFVGIWPLSAWFWAFSALGLLPGRADALTFTAEKQSVVARVSSDVVWQNDYNLLLENEFAPGDGGLVGPVEAGGLLYYAVGVSLYQVEPATGRVLQRRYLPGFVGELRAEGDRAAITVKSRSKFVWPWQRNYLMGPDGNDIPFHLVLSGGPPLSLRRDARNVLARLLPAEVREKNDAPVYFFGAPEARTYLAPTAAELSRLADRDPTNPWYYFYLGECFRELGQPAAAAEAYRKALSLDRAYDLDLLGMALPLDNVAPELADEAFARGLRFLLERGYEPWEVSLVAVQIYYGQPRDLAGQELDLRSAGTPLPRLNQLGERLWRLAPVTEFVAGFFWALANENRRQGQEEQAKVWEARTREAEKYQFLAFPNAAVEMALPSTNLITGGILALILVLVVKTLRTAATFRRLRRTTRGAARWLPLAAWSRPERAGLVLTAALTLWAGHLSLLGLTAASPLLQIPPEAFAGGLGHPKGVEYWKQAAGTPAGDFVAGVALYQAGHLDEAAELFRKAGTPAARANLGVIEWRRGKREGANRLFQEALAEDRGLAEAAFNLGQDAASPLVSHAKAVGRQAPLLVLPDEPAWSAILLQLGQAQWLKTGGFPYFLVDWRMALAVGLLLLLLALWLLRVPAPRPEAAGRSWVSITGWALGFVIPGTDRRAGFAGPVLLCLLLYSALVKYYLVISGGAASNLFAAMAQPSWPRFYGIGEAVPPRDLLSSPLAANLWWVIWLLSLAFTLWCEYRRPDPAGWWGTTGVKK